MINIIEAGKSIKRQNMLTLIADLETYTLRNKISIIFQKLLWMITSISSLFLKIFGKSIDKYEVTGFETRYEENLNELMVANNEMLYTSMIEQIAKSIGIAARYRKNMMS